jgi:hypothetical protein
MTGLRMTKHDDVNKNNDNVDDDDDNSQHDTRVLVPLEEEKDEPISLAELAQLEEMASRRIMQRLLLPTRIGEAITFGVQLFVVVGIFLNMNGYGYVIRNDGSHWIGIDTLENRQFQMELRKKN